MQLGQRIKQRRQELNLSQREMAEQVGLTPGFMSQIEHDLITPSIESLRKISEVLDVPLSDSSFLVEMENKSPVVPTDKRLKLTLPGSHVSFELLTSDLKQPMDVLMVELTPEDGNIATLLPPRITEECVYVTQGQLEIKLGENVYLLNSGDSIYFEGIHLRRLVATGEETLRFIIAITPSVF
jgi:transcriptional regulator with XRE-family HTH domain